MSNTGGRTRREIMADAAKMAAAASVAGLAGCFPDVGGHWAPVCVDPDAGASANVPAPRPVTPTVVEVSNANSVNAKSVIQPDVVAQMLDAGLAALAKEAALFNATLPAPSASALESAPDTSNADGGVENADGGAWGAGSDPDSPWRVLLPGYRPGMRIGLKVNCLSPYVPTSPALVRAIVVSLRDKLGVDPAKIVVWDRRLDELNRHGKYSADDLAGAQLLGTILQPVQDGGVPETSNVGQPGYGDPISPTIECQSPRLSRILTDLTDLTINCPVFKRHGVSGITAAMKNIYGIIDIPGNYHKPLLETALPKLYALPAIRNSISLTIVDALVAEVTSDTADQSDFEPRKILLAQDPVAMDSYALVLLDTIRASIANGLPPTDTKLTRWIDNAAARGLGTKSFSLVPLVQV
jgi:uncharacterized protein (DUF362 family)